MDPLSPAALKAQQTYDLAADCFDAGPLEFWARYGRRTVDRLRLRPGARVLDVACGTGASALPAAHAVGPTGHVIGVDLAERLFVLAQEKAARQKLVNLEFRQGDMTRLEYPDGAFDAEWHRGRAKSEDSSHGPETSCRGHSPSPSAPVPALSPSRPRSAASGRSAVPGGRRCGRRPAGPRAAWSCRDRAAAGPRGPSRDRRRYSPASAGRPGRS